MVRVSVSLPDAIVKVVDEEANRKEISRSELVAIAVDYYLKGVNQSFIEVNKIKTELNQVVNQLAERDRELKSLSSELIKSHDEFNQTRNQLESKTKENEALARDNDKINFAMKSREDEINFLRGHLSQLTEKMLAPGQEEAKAKRWYQFWRRG